MLLLLPAKKAPPPRRIHAAEPRPAAASATPAPTIVRTIGVGRLPAVAAAAARAGALALGDAVASGACDGSGAAPDASQPMAHT